MRTKLKFAAGLVLAGLAAGPVWAQSKVVTIYAADGLHDGSPNWYQTQFDAFTKATGIKVQYIEGGSAGVVDRLEREKTNPQADVLGTLPPFIQKAAADGLLVAYTPRAAVHMAATNKDPNRRFYAMVNNYPNWIYNAYRAQGAAGQLRCAARSEVQEQDSSTPPPARPVTARR